MPFIIEDEQVKPSAPSKKRFVIEDDRDINDTFAQKIHRVTEPYFEPALEAGLSTAGGITLAPLGPIGIAVGEGIGFAGAKRVEKYIEDMIGIGQPETIKEGFINTGADLMAGTTYGAGGINVGAGLSRIGAKILAPEARRLSIPGDEIVTDKGSLLLKKTTGELEGHTFDPKLKKFVPSPEAKARLDIAREYNITVTPAEITRSKPLSLMESLLDKIAFSAGIIQDSRLLQLKELAQKRSELLSRIGASAGTFDEAGRFVSTDKKAIEDIGIAIQDEVNDYLATITKGKIKIVDEMKDMLLSKLGILSTFDELGRGVKDIIKTQSQLWQDEGVKLFLKAGQNISKGTTINAINVQKTALEFLRQQLKRRPAFRDNVLIKRLMDLSGTSQKTLDIMENLPEAQRKQILTQIHNKLDWEELQFMTQDLNRYIAEADEAVKIGQSGVKGLSSVEGGIYKQLKKAVVADIKEFSDTVGGQAKEDLDIANQFWSEGKKVWNSKFMRKLLTSNPDKVVDMTIKPNQTTDIKLIKRAIGEGFKLIKDGFSNKILNTFDIKKPKALANILKRYGDDVLKEVYTPNEIKELKQLASLDFQVDKTLRTNRFFRAIVNTSPEKVIGFIIKPNNTTKIDMIQSIVGKEGMKDIAAAHIERIMKLNQHELFSPQQFITQLNKWGDKTNKRLFGEEMWKDLQKFAEVSRITRGAESIAGNPSGTAQNLISFVTGGMVLKDPIKKSWLVIAPNLLARIYLSKPAMKLLTTGINMPSTSPEAIRLFTKLATLLEVGRESRQKEERRKLKTRNRRFQISTNQ